MTSLFTAMNANTVRTENGQRTLASSMKPTVDLFYKWGGSRGKFNQLTASLAGAIAENKDVAVRILLWGRDARSGAGERQLFKNAIDYLAQNEMLTLDEARRLLVKTPEIGRWDDLKAFVGTALEDEALLYWGNAAASGNGLAAKWAPRKGEVAAKMRNLLGMTPKQFRKMLVNNTTVVETAMCANEWNGIDFSKVPSVASARYQKAFREHAPVQYEAWKAELVKPENERDPKVKVNANAVYPYDIIKSLSRGDRTVANEQWKALPNFMEGSSEGGIMPMIDVSGSMTAPANGEYSYGANMVTCMDIAVSLGLYISERNEGVFKDQFMTFSGSPAMVQLKGSLSDRMNQMQRSDWGFNTDLIKAFRVMLDAAKKNNVPESEMPKTLLIISDMQFDQCARYDDTQMESIERQYREAGYERPNIVFWNVRTSNGVPVAHDKRGAALVSGFSPSIMKSVLQADDMTPEAMMLKTVMNDQYKW